MRSLVKIMVFLHGTTIMHGGGVGRTREERVRQIVDREESVRDFDSYVPIDHAVAKLQTWKEQGAEIVYLSSHRAVEDVEKDQSVLRAYAFPTGEVLFRRDGEDYRHVAERIAPDILVEDDCESIGGEEEMTYPHIQPGLKTRIKSIAVKEFGGIDHLPDQIAALVDY